MDAAVRTTMNLSYGELKSSSLIAAMLLSNHSVRFDQ